MIRHENKLRVGFPDNMIVSPSFIPVGPGNEAGRMGDQSRENQSTEKL